MGQVTVTLNGRSYRLRCGDGEEARLTELAAHVARKIDELAQRFGQHADERLLLMAALLITDELLDLKARQGDAEGASAIDSPLVQSGIAPDAGQPVADQPSADDAAPRAADGSAAAVQLKGDVATPSPARSAPTPARASLEARLSQARNARVAPKPVET